MTGLNCNFGVAEGKFLLSSGSNRAKDAIWFYCIFDRYRVYCSGYGANFVTLLQRPTSQIVANKTILMGILRKGIDKYVPNVKVRSMDIGYLYTDRKNINLLLEYDVVDENNSEPEVIFI